MGRTATVGSVADRFIGAAGAAASAPVSYTHLRAHETVLDLVCRLLLEKKKKTKNRDTTALSTTETYSMTEQLKVY